MHRRGLIPILLVLTGTLLGGLMLEAFLQAAALAVKVTHPSVSRTWLPGRRRVLCLGDSNTYGLYMRDRSDAYPAQLEKLWNESGMQPQIEVLNAGYPGTNSSRLRKNFRPMLETVRPDVVLVMIGANDYWTVRVAVDDSRSWLTALWDVVRQHSRLYRFLFMLVRGADRRQFALPEQRSISADPEQSVHYGDTEFSFGWKRAQKQRDHDQQLLANLEAIAEEAQRFDARLVLLTYASKEANYGDGGRLTRIAAQEAKIPLVDIEQVFTPLCPKEPCPELFFKDHHLTANGYRIMAEALVKQRLGENPP
jgi:lysophospholipase L1-like esterase